MPSATASAHRVCSAMYCSCDASMLVRTGVVDLVRRSARYRSSLLWRTRPLSEQAAMRRRTCRCPRGSGVIAVAAVIRVVTLSLLITSAPVPPPPHRGAHHASECGLQASKIRGAMTHDLIVLGGGAA